MGKNTANQPKAENHGTLHLMLQTGDVPSAVLIPGAPERTLKMANHWTDVVEVASQREFKTVRGRYQNIPIAAVSTGIGAASSEICLSELHQVGVDTAIRVGTTGSIVPEFDLGDLIIVTGAVRQDGSSQTYIDPAYPAVADFEVVSALQEACERLGFRYGFGIAYTVGSFYIGQGRPIGKLGASFFPESAENLFARLAHTGVTNIEMEAAGQLVIGRLHGMRMGCLLSVISNRITDRWGDNGGEDRACLAASEAIRILKERETQASELCVRKG